MTRVVEDVLDFILDFVELTADALTGGYLDPEKHEALLGLVVLGGLGGWLPLVILSEGFQVLPGLIGAYI